MMPGQEVEKREKALRMVIERPDFVEYTMTEARTHSFATSGLRRQGRRSSQFLRRVISALCVLRHRLFPSSDC
jgi:hypothetical protein